MNSVRSSIYGSTTYRLSESLRTSKLFYPKGSLSVAVIVGLLEKANNVIIGRSKTHVLLLTTHIQRGIIFEGRFVNMKT